MSTRPIADVVHLHFKRPHCLAVVRTISAAWPPCVAWRDGEVEFHQQWKTSGGGIWIGGSRKCVNFGELSVLHVLAVEEKVDATFSPRHTEPVNNRARTVDLERGASSRPGFELQHGYSWKVSSQVAFVRTWSSSIAVFLGSHWQFSLEWSSLVDA